MYPDIYWAICMRCWKKRYKKGACYKGGVSVDYLEPDRFHAEIKILLACKEIQKHNGMIKKERT